MFQRRKNNSWLLMFLVFLFLGYGCHPKAGAIEAGTNPDSVSQDDQNMLSCYTLKPVFQDAKDIEEDSLYWPGYNPNLEVLNVPIDSYTQDFDLKAKPHFDSSMKYITSFEYQAEIAINDDCLDNLNHPDNIFLQQIYFPLQSLPLGKYSFSPVSFTGMEKRFILNFGHALVYKYSLKAADVSPHFLYIFLKDTVDLPQNSGFSQGIVLCSNGMIWKDKQGYSMPFFKHTLGDHGYVSLLNYDGHKFIPIASFKQ